MVRVFFLSIAIALLLLLAGFFSVYYDNGPHGVYAGYVGIEKQHVDEILKFLSSNENIETLSFLDVSERAHMGDVRRVLIDFKIAFVVVFVLLVLQLIPVFLGTKTRATKSQKPKLQKLYLFSIFEIIDVKPLCAPPHRCLETSVSSTPETLRRFPWGPPPRRASHRYSSDFDLRMLNKYQKLNSLERMSEEKCCVITKSLFWGGACALAFVTLFALSSLFDFGAFWTAFHLVLFPQGNWQFPVDSTLITLFPQQFFENFARQVLLATASYAVVLFILATYLGAYLASMTWSRR